MVWQGNVILIHLIRSCKCGLRKLQLNIISLCPDPGKDLDVTDITGVVHKRRSLL